MCQTEIDTVARRLNGELLNVVYSIRVEGLKDFAKDGYEFVEQASSDDLLEFQRPQPK